VSCLKVQNELGATGTGCENGQHCAYYSTVPGNYV
jgi:hypothetical protein